MGVRQGLAVTGVKRAAQQANANTETHNGSVVRVYTDANGNVTAADVRVTGTTRDLVRVTNNSGLKLYAGGPVSLNFVRGNRHAPVIVGGSGSSAAMTLAANSSAGTGTSTSTRTSTLPDLTGVPLLLEGADPEVAPDAYVAAPGANVFIQTTEPVNTASSGGSGSGDAPGLWVLSARPLVMAALPDATATSLPDGTCVDVIDSYGGAVGMYRLDAAVPAWRRRDAGNGTSGVTGETGTGLTVATVDGSVSVANVTTLLFPNGTLMVVSPGVVRYTPAATGGATPAPVGAG